MDPDLYLYVTRVNAGELRAEAARRAPGGPPPDPARALGARRTLSVRTPVRTLVTALERRLGWAMVEAGLRLIQRHAA
ncbi:hypothetical protein [Nonomuraea pusilla]|uniref:Uncharacterized protein n=1 Tax=Nonomuraea pusilla TaxID=46177 RepID=A0A1H8B1F9_9ACTN|nr:hypothetical protein [Nonomuraea pusilla]SEM76802.1 hypothetical protein SAMN05660976_05988 [Nonomuraea pusilla]